MPVTSINGARQVEEPPRDRKADRKLLLNPELSRLSFNERIMAFAEDASVPLLERVRFLGMMGDRIDDFFMSRVAHFKEALAEGDTELTLDGLTAAEQLDVIARRVRKIEDRAAGLLERLLGEIGQEGIHVERWASLSEEDREVIRREFGERIATLVKPLIADRTMPHIRNLRPALAVTGCDRDGDVDRLMLIELPGDLPRFLPLEAGRRFVPMEDAIAAALPTLYPGLSNPEAWLFRVTRSAQMDFDDDRGNVLRTVEREVARRPYQEVVRLECERAMPAAVRGRLLDAFQAEGSGQARLEEQDVYDIGRLLDLAALSQIADLDRPELKYGPIQGRERVRAEHGMLDHARRRDLLLYFPYDDFEASVERFLLEAANDPDVVRVAITLYRTSRDSAIIEALRVARAKGKEVIAVVELKASFDEQENIAWARELGSGGIRVILSPVEIKVHAKIGLIVRREGGEMRRVAYVGTGNMNASTARTYVDFGLLTADPELTREVASVFDLMTGDASTPDFTRLLVAPFEMRERFLQMIHRETEHARAGRPAGIRLHINGLGDRRCIEALYQASQAGVRIELMVRDLCALRPGLPGVSDNISVVSVVGRLLHHARIFHFRNGGDDEYFIGSADWRPRNFNERVEVVVQIRQRDHQAELDAFLTETLGARRAWRLTAEGEYIKRAAS
jgi:polyphosphate kinase